MTTFSYRFASAPVDSGRPGNLQRACVVIEGLTFDQKDYLYEELTKLIARVATYVDTGVPV